MPLGPSEIAVIAGLILLVLIMGSGLGKGMKG
jgi:hypothetical protein